MPEYLFKTLIELLYDVCQPQMLLTSMKFLKFLSHPSELQFTFSKDQ